jgi:hypothetical protein
MTKKQISRTLIFLVTIVTVLFRVPMAHAASGALYISPASKTVYSGSTFNVSVRFSSSSAVNAAQVNITYPADKLDFVSVSYGGSAFEIQAQSSGGGGNVTISRGTTGALTGDKLIGTLSFRAKTNTGSATISVLNSSKLVYSTEVSSTKAGATIQFATAPPAPVPAPEPVKDTSAPTISDLKITEITALSFSVTWTTNEPADSYIEYGLNANYGFTIGTADKVTAHSVRVEGPLVLPKTDYIFRATSTDTAGNKVTGDQNTTSTKGVPLLVLVTDQTNKPLKDATVSIDGEESTTKSDGTALFLLTKGKKTIAVHQKNLQTTGSFTIDDKNVNVGDLHTTLVLQGITTFPAAWVFIAPTFLGGLFIGHFLWRNQSPLKHIKKGKPLKKHYLQMRLSLLEKRFGDRDTTSNPYYKQSIISRVFKNTSGESEDSTA